MTTLVGQEFGRYKILEQLGQGGLTAEYKAYDTQKECEVVVQVFSFGYPGSEIADKTRERFEREARALTQLEHTNIAKVIDYGENRGLPYLVMEYLPGETLKQQLTGKPMAWETAVDLLIPIARALDYAHKQGMLHRDIKPGNILITDSGEPMLLDLGITKLFYSEEPQKLTSAGIGPGTPDYMPPEEIVGEQIIGTPDYMAPEHITTKTIGFRADMYALGVVFYEMVTGRKPYVAETPIAVMFKHANEPLPRPKSFVADLPDAVERVLFKALAKNPQDRYRDMGVFTAALENLSADKRANAEDISTPEYDIKSTLNRDQEVL